MSEIDYKILIDNYLSGSLAVRNFVEGYIQMWKQERDEKIVYDDKFQRLKDRFFSTCDCYSEEAATPFEISEEQLKDEIRLLSYIWWG